MAQRLEDEVLGRDAKVVVKALVKGIGRDDGHWQLGAALEGAQAPDRLPAVNARHGQVHQDHIRPVAGGQQV